MRQSTKMLAVALMSLSLIFSIACGGKKKGGDSGETSSTKKASSTGSKVGKAVAKKTGLKVRPTPKKKAPPTPTSRTAPTPTGSASGLPPEEMAKIQQDVEIAVTKGSAAEVIADLEGEIDLELEEGTY